MNLASASTNANNIYKMALALDGLSQNALPKRRLQYVTERGSVDGSTKKGNGYPVGPILLGFFFFVFVGSSLFQIIKTATSKGMV